MSFKLYSKEDAMKKLEQFLDEESLFLTISPIADFIDNNVHKKTTKVENWEDAKEFVKTLLQSKHPDRILDTHAQFLYDDLASYTMTKRGHDGYYGLEGFTQLTENQHRNELEVLFFYSIAILKCIELFNEERDYSLLLDPIINNITNSTLQMFIPRLQNAIEGAFEDETLCKDYNYVRNMSAEEELWEEEQRRREENVDKWLRFFEVNEYEIIVWKWLSDNKEHWGQPEDLDTDYFDAIIKEMIDDGLVKEPASCDNGYKLTIKGIRRLEGWIQEKLPSNLPDNKVATPNKEMEGMKSRINEDHDAYNEELEVELEDLSAFSSDLKRRVRINLALKVLGIKDFSTFAGNKSKLIQVIAMLTNDDANAVQTTIYRNIHNLTKRDHGNEIDKLNELLKECGLMHYLLEYRK